MLPVKTVRERVEAFKSKHEMPELPEAFAAWFLAQNCRLSAMEAIARVSDRNDGRGNYDGGTDAYHLRRMGSGPPVLTILQAKFSEDKGYTRRGINDLRRAVTLVTEILNVGPTEMAAEHRVVKKLRAELSALSKDERSALELKCILNTPYFRSGTVAFVSRCSKEHERASAILGRQSICWPRHNSDIRPRRDARRGSGSPPRRTNFYQIPGRTTRFPRVANGSSWVWASR